MKNQNKKIKQMYDLANSLVGNSKKKINDITSKIYKWRKKKAMELFKDGVRLFKLKEKKAAVEELKKAYRINPKANKELTKEQIAFFIAGAYSSMKDCRKELQYHTTAIRCNSRFFDAWFEKGLIYLDLGKRKVYNINDPIRGRLRIKLTNRKRLYKEALNCFKKAEISDPKSAKAVYYVGYLYELLNKSKEAIKMFDKVLELDGDFVNIVKSELFSKIKNESKKVSDVCSKCNSKIKEKDKFCQRCGTKIR